MTEATLVVEEHLQLPVLPSCCRNKIKVRPQIIYRQHTYCAVFISEFLCKCKKHYSDPHFCQGLFSPLQELFPVLSLYVLSSHLGAKSHYSFLRCCVVCHRRKSVRLQWWGHCLSLPYSILFALS